MQNWNRVISWLDENAPMIKDALQAPATDELLEKVESLVGLELPEQFKNLYQVANGVSPESKANLFYGMTFIPLERVMQHLEAFHERGQDFDLVHADEGIRKDYRVGTSRIPFGDDFGTSLLCIDLNPDTNGKVGQIVYVDYNMDTALLMSSSIESLIASFADDLEAGKYSLLEEAKDDGVDWLDPDRTIDPVNWYNSPTWSYVK